MILIFIYILRTNCLFLILLVYRVLKIILLGMLNSEYVDLCIHENIFIFLCCSCQQLCHKSVLYKILQTVSFGRVSRSTHCPLERTECLWFRLLFQNDLYFCQQYRVSSPMRCFRFVYTGWHFIYSRSRIPCEKFITFYSKALLSCVE